LTISNIQSNSLPKCSCCAYRHFCIKGCLGSQYESSGEVFVPIPTVCEMFIQKIEFLYKTYKEMGVFDSAIRQKLLFEDELSALKEFELF